MKIMAHERRVLVEAKKPRAVDEGSVRQRALAAGRNPGTITKIMSQHGFTLEEALAYQPRTAKERASANRRKAVKKGEKWAGNSHLFRDQGPTEKLPYD